MSEPMLSATTDTDREDVLGLITSLGQAFADEAARQAFFQRQLRVWLDDANLRRQEGFPVGTTDAIVQLSDPPYYTACPNPFLRAIVQEWQANRPVITGETPGATGLSPYATLPVSTKTDKSYMLHTYHSKMPASTLEHLIEHFCASGDIVLDCFCGSGVTGVACANVAARGKAVRAVLLDLSPAATFISYNYLFPVQPTQLLAEGEALLAELAPLYESLYADERGTFDYTIYADVFTCPACTKPVTFWEGMVDMAAMRLQPTFHCIHCGAPMPKNHHRRRQITWHDPVLQAEVTQAQQLPVARKYGRKLHTLLPAERQAAENNLVHATNAVPVLRWPDGANLSQPKRSHGITYVHHLFTSRNLTALAHLWEGAAHYGTHRQLHFAITAFMLKTGSRLHNIGFKQGNINLAGQLPNTYYLPNLSAERHIGRLFADKLNALADFYQHAPPQQPVTQPSVVISTGSATALDLPDNSIDYCLTDPPFGGFVHYGELNFVWEAWLGVMANRRAEAIIYEQDGKDHNAYQALMTGAFCEIYRVLKPGKWLTLVFHNSKNVVWRSIQEALFEAGFVVADVRAAARGQGSYKQMTATVAIQTDLLVSAYKPAEAPERPVNLETGTLEGVWAFVRAHLQQLPIVGPMDATGKTEVVTARQNSLLFDQMIAFHIRQGITVPISATEFYRGLVQGFPERDGMYFLPEQAAKYDRQ